MVAVGVVPVLILAMVAVLAVRRLDYDDGQGLSAARDQLASDTAAATLRSAAAATGRDIDRLVADRIDTVAQWARQPIVADGAAATAARSADQHLGGLTPADISARLPATDSLGAAPLTDAFLAAELDHESDFADIAYSDGAGITGGAIGGRPDLVQRDAPGWAEAWSQGRSIGPPTRQAESGQYVIPVVIRIESQDGQPLGVLTASLRLAALQSVADQHADAGIGIMVTAATGTVLAETATGHDPARIGAADLRSLGLDTALATDNGTTSRGDTIYAFSRLGASVADGPNPPAAAVPEGADALGLSRWVVLAGEKRAQAQAELAELSVLDGQLNDGSRDLAIMITVSALLTALAAAVVAMRTSRQVVRPLIALAEASRAAAQLDPSVLPSSRPAATNPAITTPAITIPAVAVDGDDEVGQVARSFNLVHRTAVELAAEGANRRQATLELVANLGHRNQSLVRRQLRVIDELERSEQDPDRLRLLFQLDHLLTRGRRNAESLLVIAGHRSQSRRSEPVRAELVVQGALGEVEHYERVDTRAVEPAAMAGWIATDLAHLLAELTENALAASPPQEPVEIRGFRPQRGAAGDDEGIAYTFAVVDRGLGFNPEDLAAANQRLSVEPDLSDQPSDRLGLLVVARLAARHGLRVRLRLRVSGGLQAEVSVPAELVHTAAPLPAPVVAAPPAAPVVAPAAMRPAPLVAPAMPPAPLVAPAGAAPSTPVAPSAGIRARAASAVESQPSGTVPVEVQPAPAVLPPRRQSQVPASAEAVRRPQELSPAAARLVTPVTRRQAVVPTADEPRPAHGTRAKRRIATASTGAEAVAGEADQVRQRWSRFHQGRRQAAQTDQTDQTRPSGRAAPTGPTKP